jgi:hypothetical protein
LIQEQQLLSFKNPAQRPLSTFQRYFFGGEKDETVLGGPDEHLLDDPKDLVALASLDNDRLSGFLRDNFGWCFKVSRSLDPLSLKGLKHSLGFDFTGYGHINSPLYYQILHLPSISNLRRTANVHFSKISASSISTRAAFN